MIAESEIRERVVALEVKVQYLTDSVNSMDKKVDEIHTLMTEARGAQKAVRFLIWLSGTLVFVWGVTYYKAIMAVIKGP